MVLLLEEKDFVVVVVLSSTEFHFFVAILDVVLVFPFLEVVIVVVFVCLKLETPDLGSGFFTTSVTQ